MYELPPFEDTFHPMKHNKYLMRRNDVVSRFVSRLLMTCHDYRVSRYSTSQGYYQQAAHSLAKADQTRLMAERLGAAFTWGRVIYEGLLIGQGRLLSHSQTSLLLRSRHFDERVMIMSSYR